MSIAIVTGAAAGIGQAIATRFVQDGRTVVLVDRQAVPLKEMARRLSTQGTVMPVVADVAKPRDVRRAVQAVVKRFRRIDILINNAGAFHHAKSISPSVVWERLLHTNLFGAYYFALEAAPALRRARGTIINMASTRALMSEPGTEAYAATKGGLVALTHALAISLGPDVRVNCISPGWIDTTGGKTLRAKDHAQHPVGRVGRPDDIAGLASYLVSSDAGFITGQNIIIDGGMTRKMIYEP